ncbi:hypothetical protein [Pontibacter ruber]|uniref:Uncharacterized protein n=1 Tax=Pontibacter ruber TaxID=1343895 RepID=A0ABW5D0Z7_9BACT|nr:hypothetical protein [Pontibacter ruber]
MKKLYVLLLAVLVLSACDKEEEGPQLDYPAAFELQELYNTTPVRMYTRRGEVKDAALIKRFAEQWGAWYHLEDKKETTSAGETIMFQSASDVQVNRGNYSLKMQGQDLLITSKGEGTGMYYQNEEFYFDLWLAISKYRSHIYDRKPLASGSGNISYGYKIKDQWVATLPGDDLHIHRMVSTLKSGDGTAFSVKTTSSSNRFDPGGLSLLRSTDTLLVQEFVLVGKRKQ